MSLAAVIFGGEELFRFACVVRASFCAALACEKYDGVGLRGAGLAQLFGAAAGVFAGFVGRRLICALRFARYT